MDFTFKAALRLYPFVTPLLLGVMYCRVYCVSSSVKASLRAESGRDAPSLTGEGVEINNGNVVPWRATHPQVCLHLAYILPITDFPTPGFSPVLVLQDLTITSSWGSSAAAAVQQQCVNWDLGLTR